MSYRQMRISGPFMGVVDNVPRPAKPPNSFDDILNFIVRHGRIQTRPRLNPFTAPPDGAIVRNIVSYNDVLNNAHTLVLTTRTAYGLATGPVLNPLTLPTINSVAIADLTGTALPYGVSVMTFKAFFSNGSRCLMYADGSSTIQAAGTDIAADGFACRFLGVLNQHAIAAYTTEPPTGVNGSQRFPFRVRWSQPGTGLLWASPSGGFNDLLEVPDEITGFAALGQNGYIFRTNGITVMGASGNGAAPFYFQQYSNGLQGIGCTFPYTLSVYGAFAVFVSATDVFIFDGVSLTPIGGGAKKRIFDDLEHAAGDEVTGAVVPVLGKGFEYLSYWLSIPSVSTWVYSYEDQAWMRFSSPLGNVTTVADVVVS